METNSSWQQITYYSFGILSTAKAWDCRRRVIPLPVCNGHNKSRQRRTEEVTRSFDAISWKLSSWNNIRHRPQTTSSRMLWMGWCDAFWYGPTSSDCIHRQREEGISRTHTKYSYTPVLPTVTYEVWMVGPGFWKQNITGTNIGTKLGTEIGAIRTRHQATSQSCYRCVEEGSPVYDRWIIAKTNLKQTNVVYA